MSTSLREVSGVGARRWEHLQRLGLLTVHDLLRHLPMRYEHHFAEGMISDLPMDGVGAARGTLVATRWTGPPGGSKGRFEATLEDHSARLKLTWFNAAYLRRTLHPGLRIRVQGKVKAFNGYPQMVNPTWEALPESDEPDAKSERHRPVYPATEDLPSARIEALVAQVLPAILPRLIDPLPAHLLQSHLMPALADAFRMAHQPASQEEADAARRRLAYNELLLLQLGIQLKRHYTQTRLAAPALHWSEAMDSHIRQRFPFDLTPDQDKVIREIVGDLRQSAPMNRLLQGDVGSGKTVVALYALLLAVADRKQGAIMVPTELLAEQHHRSIARMLEGSSVRLALVTASAAGGDRELRNRLETGEIDIAIGTQALLTESVRFKELAVVVVDEQHRFGVMQRAAFRGQGETREQGGDGMSKTQSPPPNSGGPVPEGVGAGTIARLPSPHCLVMTATPIPRTLSLTIFGDLDMSTIRGLPPGRSPIVTRVVMSEKADEVYGYMAQRVRGGEQAYVVVPTIDESGEESAAQLKSVKTHAKLLAEKYCEGLVVEQVHGRLEREEREAVMQRFSRGQVQVLVATTVIEVGVDVPNATIMVVEHAERFGLAQLHQLRGRIGRGTHKKKSLCVFIAQANTPQAQQRMEAIGATTDGFKIAEKDLEIRGMGEFFGTRQHGAPPLRVARIPEDMPLLDLARRDSESILINDPTLHDEHWSMLRKVLIQQYGEALGLVDVG